MQQLAALNSIIIMGVAGSGKSTVGAMLAKTLGWHFIEGDDFHSEQAKSMMAAGIPLTEALRDSWVLALCHQLQHYKSTGQQCVLSYSGLIAKHRQAIRQAGAKTQFFYLQGSEAVLSARLAARKNHFMPASMLQSQLGTMQSCDNEADICCLDISLSATQLVEHILAFQPA